MNRPIRTLPGPAVLAGLLALSLVPLMPGRSLGQYHTTENTPIPNQQQGGRPSEIAPTPAPSSHSGPVRLARFAYVKGEVSWRPDSSVEWAQAATNLPLRQ